jgi:hypothetical protein
MMDVHWIKPSVTSHMQENVFENKLLILLY